MNEKTKKLATRTVTGLLYVAIMLTCFLRPLSMIFLFALVTGLAVWEFTGLVNNIRNAGVNRFITTVAGVYLFLAIAFVNGGMVGNGAFVPYLLTVVYLFISELYERNENPINSWAFTMLSQMYIALPLAMVNVLAFRESADGTISYSAVLPLSVFVFLWLNDTGAYLSGMTFGKHKLFPRISPAKTWEGSVGGGLLVIAVAAVAGFSNNGFLNEAGLTALEWIGMGVVVVVSGTWGDLVESLFKRTLGIKDSGNILPGHGGMLDRFDSSLMAVPSVVVYLYALTLL